jgi:gas vesicle protein
MDFTLQFYKDQAEKFSSELTDEKEKNQRFATEKETLQFEQRKSEFEAFLDKKSESGDLPPVIREKCVALFSHLDSIEVEDGSESALDVFKQVIDEIKSQVEFGSDYDDGGAEHVEFSAEELAVKAAEFREEQRKKGVSISATQAVNHIKNQNHK